MVFVAMLAVVALGAHSVQASSDTCTWTGAGADSNLTTAGNWTGCDNGNVPENGDTLVFPAGPTNKVVTINSPLQLESATFSGSGYVVATTDLPNNQLVLTSSLTISGEGNVFQAFVRFFDDSGITLTHSGSGTIFDHYLVIQPGLGEPDAVFDIQTDLTLPMIAQTSNPLGHVTKSGTGTIELTGDAIAGLNTTGGTTIEEGVWKCDGINCLGDTNEIILSDGGDEGASELYLGAGGTIVNPITTNAVAAGQHSNIDVAADVTFTGALTCNDRTNLVVSGAHTATVQSNVAIASGKSLATYGGEGYATNNAEFTGIISGNASLIFSDIHASLSGSNTYTGTTDLYNNGGGTLLTVVDNNSLGNSSSGTTVHAGATLEFNDANSIFYDEPITATGNGVGGSYPGALVKSNKYVGLYGGLTLEGNTTIHNATAQNFGFLSAITGNYDLTLTAVDDTGGFAFQPGSDNSFGNVIANGTQVSLYGAGIKVIPHDITLHAVNGHLSTIYLNNDHLIADDGVITLVNDGAQTANLINNGVAEELGSIEGDGVITITDSDGHFMLGDGNISGTFSGTVVGYTNSMFEIQGGTWTFNGTNTDEGNGYSSYYVNGGKFLANASDTSLGESPFSMSAGTLGGSGTVGQTAVYSGTISPGNSPGCMNVNGDVAFSDPNSYYAEQLQGTTACSGYDKLTATGTIYLNNATLSPELLDGFSATSGHVFTIMEAQAVSGTFDGLADGAAVTVGGRPFTIHYTATSVTLTYTGPTIPAAAATSSGGLASSGQNALMYLGLGCTLLLTGFGLAQYQLKRSMRAMR